MQGYEFSHSYDQWYLCRNRVLNSFASLVRSDEDSAGIWLELVGSLLYCGEQRQAQMFPLLAWCCASDDLCTPLNRLLRIGCGDSASKALVDDSRVLADLEVGDGVGIAASKGRRCEASTFEARGRIAALLQRSESRDHGPVVRCVDEA